MARTKSWRVGFAVAGILSTVVAAQQRPAGPMAANAPRAAIPRAPDGHPDLQGVWTNGTLTPFERPATMGTKAFMTEDEAAAQAKAAADRRATPAPRRPGDVGNDNEAFVDRDYTYLPTRQTSLVVDPPDGRVPIRAEAMRRRDTNLESLDNFETMSPWDRCITRGPIGLMPSSYNNGRQIIQTTTHVVVLSEMIHEARIIPVDGSPHPGARVRSWTGDSRGRWDGDTLVVETTNVHDRGWLSTHAGSGRLRGLPNSEALRIVERFTRTSADTLIYEMTVEDPAVFERPWTVSMPLVRDDSYQIFEYACHEGNKATELMLRGARTLEREATGRR